MCVGGASYVVCSSQCCHLCVFSFFPLSDHPFVFSVSFHFSCLSLHLLSLCSSLSHIHGVSVSMSPAGWHTCGVLAVLGQSGDLAAGRRHHAKEKRDTSAKKPD